MGENSEFINGTCVMVLFNPNGVILESCEFNYLGPPARHVNNINLP